MLEVYGVGYPDDTDKVKYNNRQSLTHIEQAIEELENLIEHFLKVSSQLRTLPLVKFNGEAMLKSHFKALLDIIIEGF